MKLLTDHWTYKIDGLGYEKFATNLCRLLINAHTPAAITISGRWGTGKTSMLRYVMRALGGDPSTSLSTLGKKTTDEPDEEFKLPPGLQDIKQTTENVWTVWFNPWQYQAEQNPMIPLLHEIRSQISLSEKLVRLIDSKEIKAGFLDAMEAGLYTLGSLADDAINLSFGRKVISSGAKFSEQIEKRYEKRRQKRFSEPVNAQLFYLEFEKAVRQIVGAKGRLVIFIDDLDRCGNQTVFALLESIKLYLSCRQCVFVFGLDRIHIESALQEAGQYSMDEARQYIEKLFQASFYLPVPSPGNLLEFVKGCLHKLDLYDEKRKYEDYIVKWLPANPRVIKTALNGLPLYRSMLDADYLEDQKWLLVHFFRVLYPDVYELLRQNPEDTFQAIRKIREEGIDFHNQQQAYIFYTLENPIKQSPAIQEPQSQPGKATQMEESRFRKIRATAWQAETLHAFQNDFVDAFIGDREVLKAYLI
ncbi:MAG: KAP family P-loop NTPase fold protein [Methylococcales bacterium]